jgi:hypothetical protein
MKHLRTKDEKFIDIFITGTYCLSLLRPVAIFRECEPNFRELLRSFVERKIENYEHRFYIIDDSFLQIDSLFEILGIASQT